ncbi:ATP-binding protein [Puniceicoccaceae bacterium K14]|nr:ATP-binding protein [Puniceicoccaceae bacterium K14]
MKHTLYIVTGLPGSGKTHYGKMLAIEKGAAFIDIDTSTETLVQAAQKALGEDIDDRDSPLFKDRFRGAIYKTQFQIAAENLTHTDVVITGPFTKELTNPDWQNDLERKFGCPIQILYTQCSTELIRQRIEKRNNPRDIAKLANWSEYLKYYGKNRLPRCPYILVNTE